MLTLRYQILIIAVFITVLIAGSIWFLNRQGPTGGPRYQPVKYLPATYVGKDTCTECHEQAHEQWLGSHHDLAMQVANEDTVLGDFNGATFTHYDTTSRFYKKDGRFYAHTDGPDGEMREYEVVYTFGVEPLQQYLVAFPDGRYQVLGAIWDTRPESEGGQRWYHLYPDEPIPYHDELHWTGPNQNWNFMCAECHSTDLKKNYDPATHTFKTSYEEINVACEACHGPASNHLKWAEEYNRGIDRNDPTLGLSVRLKNDGGVWEYAPGEVTAKRSKPIENRTMINMCARCHARRGTISNDYPYGGHLLETHLLSLLDENLYFPDGQIRDEVYVHGSFLQSKMYQHGVTCTDCHDPHSMRIQMPGNALCSKCHLPDHYDTPKHHFHEQDTEGASCTDCHMPTRTYMGVDARRDHSLRVPRPDLTIKTGSPNACNTCHDDQTPQWADEALDTWYGKDRMNKPHYGEVIHAAHNQAPDADQQLAALIKDAEQPGIVRATALSLLSGYPTPLSYQTLKAYAGHEDPLLRLGMLRGIEAIAPQDRVPLAYELLSDPVYAIRSEAGRVLAPVDQSALNAEQQAALAKGVETYIESQRVSADRAEAHLNIALVQTQQGDPAGAEASYETALAVNPRSVQVYINLADLYRATGRDEEATGLLKRAVENDVNHGVIYYALGLALVRQQDTPGALEAFGKAAELAPEDPQFGYTLGIALNSTGQPDAALDALTKNHQRHPGDINSLYALMTICRDQKRHAEAVQYAGALLELNPPNADAVRGFIRQVQQLQAQPE